MQNLGFDLNVMALQARWNDFVEYAGSRWLPSIGVILAAILAYVIGRAVFTRIQKRLVTKTATDLDDHVVGAEEIGVPRGGSLIVIFYV